MPEERIARATVTLGFFVLLATLIGAQGAVRPGEIFREEGSAALASTQAPMPPQAPTPPRPAPAPLPANPSSQTAPSTQTEKPAFPPPLLVILDPAHGGADSGAHGNPEEGGAVEKDLVLEIAQGMRRELERQGVRVVLTRQGDTAFSLDERATVANSFGSGFFVSLHVASTGDANTAEAYSFGTPLGGAPPAVLPRVAGKEAVRWDHAQAAYVVASRRLAELLQVELAQKLRGSRDVPQFAQLRQLRIVAHPAVAIELSSVGEQNAGSLEKTSGPIANALVRAIAAYRQPLEARP